MSKHEHKDCEHENLKYCEKCDVVECEDCEKEWGKENVIVNPVAIPWYDPGTGFTTSPYDTYC